MTLTIEELVPRAGRADQAALNAYDPDLLARYAADPTREWWRRCPCVRALAGRVPEQWVGELVARVRDRGDVANVREALLDLLIDRAELLPWLREVDPSSEPYGMPEPILRARGLVGDRSATRELATLAASPWDHRRRYGQAGLEALVARYGVDEVLGELGDARPEDRIFALRMRHRAGADVTDGLADPDRAVARLAQSLLTDPDRLRRYLPQAPTTEAALWTALALHRLTGESAETRAVYDRLGRPRVEVPGLDAELRGAIVHEYGTRCQDRTDPRWRVEALCTEPPPLPDQDDQLRRASAALTAAGLDHLPPAYCGEYNHQGGGTYHVMEYDDEYEVRVSTLGRFVTSAIDPDPDPRYRHALEAAGFRWIDEATGDILVTDLCVYRFGHREPLTVEQLLFYWQD
ncbi:hypothetical protein [Kitasatospora viridis]|uniref:Uncharacterized protein n=1 Tax=Kitasatospora viridis TaxID=281105 RepID=A0A561TUW0_9ACTN|nr:hypothetical protein [Kitasatospora viridis]TWF90891.1 hypothetical protein FHX73_123 [Kitasatospora viridis]